MTIKEMTTELAKLNNSIKNLMHESKFDECNDLYSLEIDKSSAEELFLLDEYRSALDQLANVSRQLEYLSLQVKYEGELHKTKSGNYALDDMNIPCGYPLEYLCSDDAYMRYNEDGEYVITPFWCRGRLEYDGEKYYIIGSNKETNLEGLRVRIRK